jgi:hypothetical protein
MVDFLALSHRDRGEALAVAVTALNRPLHLLEKDVWVVWTLEQLFAGPYAGRLVFKGGTSLSKAYGVIQRFSEDVDLTYDIRDIAGDLVGGADPPLPPTSSQAKKWTEVIRRRLTEWTSNEIIPALHASLAADKLQAVVRAEENRLLVTYRPLDGGGTGYVQPQVMLEFGARSTDEPADQRVVACDAAAALPSLSFPTARTRAMRPERTFWEKATAVHVFCLQGTFRGGDRFARHWHDLARLDDHGFVDSAVADEALAAAVAQHKGWFFRETDHLGVVIDYNVATSGGIRLVPDEPALNTLRADYVRMVDDGLLLEDAESFEDLIERCRQIERKINARRRAANGPRRLAEKNAGG